MEVSSATESIDLNRKKLDYQKAGVRETSCWPYARSRCSGSSASAASTRMSRCPRRHLPLAGISRAVARRGGHPSQRPPARAGGPAARVGDPRTRGLRSQAGEASVQRIRAIMDHFTTRTASSTAKTCPSPRWPRSTARRCTSTARRRCCTTSAQLQTAFAAVDPLICYSVKTNGNLHICRLMAEHGAGFDVTSGGELYRALKAGGTGAKIVFAGVGKTDAEIRYGPGERRLPLQRRERGRTARPRPTSPRRWASVAAGGPARQPGPAAQDARQDRHQRQGRQVRPRHRNRPRRRPGRRRQPARQGRRPAHAPRLADPVGRAVPRGRRPRGWR